MIDSAEKGKTDLVIISLIRGANIHAANDEALRVASRNGQTETETVKLLLENGADIRTLTYQALKWTVKLLKEHM